MSAQFQFVMRTGPTPGTVYPLEGDLLTLGRDAGNSIAINDAEISRRHARLTFQGGKYVLEDLGSTNGTYVNGQRLGGPHVLKPGDVISFGEQISLGFESLAFDAGATVASPRTAMGPARVTPVPPPPAVPVVGQIPQGPAPAYAPPAKKSTALPIIIIVAAVLLICACIGFFWYVDANFLWCTIFPFLGGC